MDGILAWRGFGCVPKRNRACARELLARGLGMAAERRPGRKGSGWRGNREWEETMRLPNALFAGFLSLGARDELVSYM